jgi:hypothetical protein
MCFLQTASGGLRSCVLNGSLYETVEEVNVVEKNVLLVFFEDPHIVRRMCIVDCETCIVF